MISVKMKLNNTFLKRGYCGSHWASTRCPLAVPKLSLPVISQAVREIKGWPAGLGSGQPVICGVQVGLGDRLVWENKAGWLQTRGCWWPRPLPLHFTDESLGWGGEQNKECAGTRWGARAQVSPLRPQPRPAVGGTVALSWQKLDVTPPHTFYGQGPWQTLSPLEPWCSHLVSEAQRPLWLCCPHRVMWGSDQMRRLFQIKPIQTSTQGLASGALSRD